MFVMIPNVEFLENGDVLGKIKITPSTAQVRLACLELAVKSTLGVAHEDTIETAKKFEEYINGQE